MASINPYLNFNGTCDAAFEFYKSVLGGEFMMKMRMKDVAPENQPPGVDGNLIMHVSLPVGKHNVLMGSDAPEGCGPPLAIGNNISVSLHPESEEEARRLFDGLSAGGNVIMALDNMFWGALFGMFIDKFGIQWMVNYEHEQKK